MWPPMEIPGIVNVITRFSRMTGPMPLCMMLMPRRLRDHEQCADEAEDRARGADGAIRAPAIITPSEPATSETK